MKKERKEIVIEVPEFEVPQNAILPTELPLEKIEVKDNVTRRFKLVNGSYVQISKTVR
jgi:hypothetical protein